MVLRLGSAMASYDYFAALVATRGPGDASQEITISRRLEMFITGRNIEGFSPMSNGDRIDDRARSTPEFMQHARICRKFGSTGTQHLNATKNPHQTLSFVYTTNPFFTFSIPCVYFGSHSLSSQSYCRSRSLLSAGMDGLVFLLHFSVGVGWFCVDFALAFIFFGPRRASPGNREMLGCIEPSACTYTHKVANIPENHTRIFEIVEPHCRFSLLSCCVFAMRLLFPQASCASYASYASYSSSGCRLHTPLLTTSFPMPPNPLPILQPLF